MHMDKIEWSSGEEKNFFLNIHSNINIKLITEGLISYLENILEGDILNQDELIKGITT